MWPRRSKDRDRKNVNQRNDNRAMKTIKPVCALISFVAILIASTTRTFSASVSGDNAVVPTRPSCCTQWSASATNALVNVSAGTNAEAAISVECGDETKTRVNYFAAQSDAPTKATNGTKPRNTVTYFTDAVISVGKVGENRPAQDLEAATFGAATISRSFADREETRGPRGLRLFSWNW